MENLLLQGSYYNSVLKISNFGYSKSAVLDSMAVTRALGGGGGTQVQIVVRLWHVVHTACPLTWP